MQLLGINAENDKCSLEKADVSSFITPVCNLIVPKVQTTTTFSISILLSFQTSLTENNTKNRTKNLIHSHKLELPVSLKKRI